MIEEFYLMPVRNRLTLQIWSMEERPDLSLHRRWTDGWIGRPHGQCRRNGGLDFGVEQAAMESIAFLTPIHLCH